MRRPTILLLAVGFALLLSLTPSARQAPARLVILISIDGLRWQEYFSGADRDYFKRDRKGSGGAPEQRYWRPTAEERRSVLMPFMWTTIAKRGQIFGDESAASTSRLTNGLWFSYPGYSEMLAGAADSAIDSNDKIPNPNVTVLEWLNRKPAFAGRVAAFGSWDVLPSIINIDRSRIPVATGWFSDQAKDLPRYWEYGPFDAPVVYAALERLRTQQLRVLYVMLGEGDEWAHEGRYDLYLDATERADRFIRRFWETAQGLPAYKDRTAIIVTTDHGRGATIKDWTDHGKDVPAGERTWIAAMGTGVAPLGVRRSVNVTTSQIAATLAGILGEDFKGVSRAAAPSLPLTK